ADMGELRPREIHLPDLPLVIRERQLQNRRWKTEQVNLHAAVRLLHRVRTVRREPCSHTSPTPPPRPLGHGDAFENLTPHREAAAFAPTVERRVDTRDRIGKPEFPGKIH